MNTGGFVAPFMELLTMIPCLLFREVDCCVIQGVGLQGLFSFVAVPLKKVAVGDGY